MTPQFLKTMLDGHLGQIFATAADIEAAAGQIARQIDDATWQTPPLLIGVMKGAAQWTLAVSQQLTIQADLDFVAVSSYTGTKQSLPKLTQAPTLSVTNRHVILLDEIIDSGVTLAFLIDWLHEQQVASIQTAVMVNKPVARQRAVALDYVGFTLPDVWLVGYGMDLDGAYRNLPVIAEYKTSTSVSTADV
ncbi:phosphoribosyltransferase [Furfurilactobacillus curtus]|uniref:Hypoxanthine-guanine phosphoribosyltransferase n=1 Tax=Furfurilactobacillus curtus TaxID=1746200 RepID=A0ABQ5JPB2_9LACO